MRGTKEFDELMEQFEKNVKEITYGHSIKRECRHSKTPKSVFYEDGHINELFHAYMLGYTFHKSLSL